MLFAVLRDKPQVTISERTMKITWVKCETYDEAKDYSEVIYLHEWSGKPFYWGKAHKSFFGGHKRSRDGLNASGRYNSGYRHWIEGCLKHGACLFIGKLDAEAIEKIDELENYLIHKYGHVMNARVETPENEMAVEHCGDIPYTISSKLYAGSCINSIVKRRCS